MEISCCDGTKPWFTGTKGINSSVDVNPWGNVVKGYNRDLLYLSATLQSPTLELQAVGILAISDPVLSSPVIMAYSSDFAEGTDVLRFLKLGNDGNMKIYVPSEAVERPSRDGRLCKISAKSLAIVGIWGSAFTANLGNRTILAASAHPGTLSQ
ncbi:hypothetical protein MLD38_000314 [Melastoma candidum]|uniref:Uncharacterized protein n=1 Tax=Melastoma candidum TaxID=119954 RepID=A0ACB9S924_9MYRT|nr:hypothetical protein MLD38_000314 [Melastoma candidum]